MAAEPQSCTFAKGYLLKHNRDHRTSNLLPGAKYKRRWVEVTEHTFVYSPSQQDALTGRCSVFAVGDMVWVKADGDTKFMVKFPERTLKFKVAAGGQAEREQWVAALQAARKQHTAAMQALSSGTAKLEHLQKALLSPGPDLIASNRTSAESRRSGMMLSSADTSLTGSLTGAAPAASGVSAMPHGLTWIGSGFGGALEQQTECGQQQPLSPRSLLASARAGMALVSSAAGTPRARTPPPAAAAATADPQPKPVQERFFAHPASDTEDEEEDDDDAASEAGSSDRDAEQHAQGDRTEAADPGGGAAFQDPAGASQAAAVVAAAEHAAHRPVLARRMTPGVLLASPRPPTPLAASPAHASPASPQLPHPSTLPANLLARVALGPPAAAGAASPSAAVRTLSVSAAQADEVLRLDDPSDSEPDSPAAPQQHASYPPASAPGRTHAPQPAIDVFSSPLYTTASTHRPASGSRSRVAKPGPSAAAALSGDQVLRLDEQDVLPTPIRPLSSTQQHHGQQAHGSSTGQMVAANEAAASSAQPRGLRPGVLQVGSRPGSGGSSRPGSAYRPGAPLKSCLRNSPSTHPTGYTP